MSLIISNHARRKAEKDFNNLNVVEVFETVVNCSKDEITCLKNTPSYKRMKASDKKNVFYKKTPSEDLYFVCSNKVSKSGVRKEMIITIIDLKLEDESFISADFLIEAKRKEFELREKSNQTSSNKKTKKAVRPNYEEVGNVKNLLQGQRNLLDKIIQFNDKKVFSYKFKYNDFDTQKAVNSLETMKNFDKLIGKINSFEQINKKLKELYLNEPKDIKHKELKLKDQFFQMIYSFLNGVTQKTKINNLRNDFYFDFQYFKVNKPTSKMRVAFYHLLADFLNSMSKTFEMFEDNKSFENNKISEKMFLQLENIIKTISVFSGHNRNLDSALSKITEWTVKYDSEKMLEFIETLDDNKELYLRSIKNDIEILSLKQKLLKDLKLHSKITKIKNFYDLLANRMNRDNVIKLSIYHIKQEDLRAF